MEKRILFFLSLFWAQQIAITAVDNQVVNINCQKTWGFFAHKKINRLAVFTLPTPLFDFYKQHIEYITEHAIDPDKRRYAVKGEAECHFLDIDHYTKSPELLNSILPIRWDEAVNKFTEDSLRKHGIAPYNIQLVMFKLGAAFEDRDSEKILKYSADLGHYIADIHVPLHTTKNYNGQLTNQLGIHAFWESRLPELFFNDYELLPKTAKYLDYPANDVWSTLIESNLYLDKVLGIEDSLSKLFGNGKYAIVERGNTIVKDYSEVYSNSYHIALNNMVQQRMLDAIELLGDIWYTAWVNAGQPDLRATSFNAKNQEIEREVHPDSAMVRAHE